MTTAQKVIKYLAIALAIFLIITIMSTIFAGLTVFAGILGLKKHIENNIGEMIITNIEDNYIENLEIDIEYTNLTIKTGDSIKIETDNKDIRYEQINNKLKIKERQCWSINHKEKNLILYLPENIELQKVKISTGAGETEIHKINVSKEFEIEGGAGKLSILSGTINNIDLGLGVGELNLNAELIGKSKINSGIGNLNIKLEGQKEDYKIKTNKGIGSIKIEGNEISSGEVYGDGENIIEVDGGIGNIDIEFK